MKNNTCPNCGAAMTINGLFFHCDYCGTEIDRDGVVLLKKENPKIKVARSKIAIDTCWVDSNPQEAEKYATMCSCRKLAQFLFENNCVDFESAYDPVLHQHVFLAKFRYVDKGEKL